MSAPLSIIIPTLNAAVDLPATLATLMPGVAAGIIAEVIVVDGGSTDPTAKVAEDAGARVVTVTASRGGQLAAGAAVAKGPWLLFLHADTHLPETWVQLVKPCFDDPDMAACFRLSFRAGGFGAWWTAGWANWRTRVFCLPYGDQGLLVSARLYNLTGGYPEQPLMEDVTMARRLKPRITMLDGAVNTGADRYLTQGWFTRGRKNLTLLVRYLWGADPERLAGSYSVSASDREN